MLIDYARVSTDGQDLTARRDALAEFGVEPSRLYVHHGLGTVPLNRGVTGASSDALSLAMVRAAARR